MINVNKLKGKIVENGLTVDDVADAMQINRSTLYRKINSGGDNISVGEARNLMTILKLSLQETLDIFFAASVA